MSNRIVIGVDPGPKESAVVEWTGVKVNISYNWVNEYLVARLADLFPGYIVAIERIRGFGIPASNDLLDTSEWIGRFHQACPSAVLIPRAEVLQHFEFSGAGNRDKAIREALVYRFGKPGTKKNPGVLYGISGHCWAALAVAVTCYDRMAKETAA